MLYIERIDKTMPMPEYKTSGAVGFDLYARVRTIVDPNSIARIPLNVIVVVPEGCMLFLKDRSSTATKGLIATAGIVDQDYHGPTDELLFQVYNFMNKHVVIDKGERIAQAVLLSVYKPTAISEIDIKQVKQESRGGFGSTGDF